MNQEITPLGLLKLLETNKEERGTFVGHVISRMLGGYVEPMDIHLQVKCMEEIVKAIKENPDYKAMVLDHAQKFGRKFEFKNAKVEVRASAGKWDYSHDAEWNRLKKMLQGREEYLKALPPEGIERREGDELVLDLPAKYSPGGDAVFVTLK